MDLCDDLLWFGLFIILNLATIIVIRIVSFGLQITICYAYITLKIILATQIFNI
jgi:hypothetical protein